MATNGISVLLLALTTSSSSFASSCQPSPLSKFTKQLSLLLEVYK